MFDFLFSRKIEQKFVRNPERQTCICGATRKDFARRLWQVTDKEDDKIYPKYYYRCPTCQTYSPINIYFPIEKYEDYYAYSNIDESKRRLNVERVNWIVSHAADSMVFRQICDLGAGEGAFCHAAAERFPEATVTAVEGDARYQAKFYTTHHNVNFVASWVDQYLETPAVFGTFDLIVLTDVLEHLIWPERTLAMIARALRPGGYLYLTAPNSDTFEGEGHPFPFRIDADKADWEHAARTCQHIFMMPPKVMERLVAEHLEVLHHEVAFETNIRKDSVYSTILARKRP